MSTRAALLTCLAGTAAASISPGCGASSSTAVAVQSAASIQRLESVALEIALEVDPGLSPEAVHGKLLELTESARSAAEGAQSVRLHRERFNRFFFIEAGFRPEAEQGSPDGLLLHRVLERRRGTCVGLAQVYLILAERLGLPVVAAATPAHLIARWVDGEARINTELLEDGAEHPDAEYRVRYRINENKDDESVFLRDLGPAEVAARIHNNVGVIRSRAGMPAAAAQAYARSIELDPRFPAPYYNRGLDQLNTGGAEQALADFEKALALHAQDPRALNNRGLARFRLGLKSQALEDFKRAVEIDPGFPAARENLERITRSQSGPPLQPADPLP